MIRIIIVGTAALLPLLQGTSVDAQERWGIELRGSGGISTQDTDREAYETGFGLEGTVQYRFLSSVAAYGGYHYTQFNAMESIAGPDMHLENTGYVAGLRFERPLREGSATSGWVRTGLTYDNLEIEDPAGEIVNESGHGLGWEFGAGLVAPIIAGWSATPGVRYRSTSRDFGIGDAAVPVELQHVAFEMGITRRF